VVFVIGCLELMLPVDLSHATGRAPSKKTKALLNICHIILYGVIG